MKNKKAVLTRVICIVLVLSVSALLCFIFIHHSKSQNTVQDADTAMNLFATYYDSTGYAVGDVAATSLFDEYAASNVDVTSNDANGSALISMYAMESTKDAKAVISRLKNTSNEAYTIATEKLGSKEITLMTGDGITYAICQVASNVYIAFDFKNGFEKTYADFKDFLGTV